MIKFDTTLGTYQPAFFQMEVDAGTSDHDKWSKHEWSVFFHEYVHFLQDCMTISGLNNIYCINEYIREIATNYAKKTPFYVPVQLIDNNNNVKLNRLLNNLTAGDNRKPFSPLTVCGVDVENYTDSVLMSAGVSFIQEVVLQTNQGECRFGCREIMESMAYILQRLCTNIDYKSPEYPYCAAEKVARYYSSNGFADNMLNVLALCDIALMTSNPGAVFVDYLYQIQQGQLTVSKPEDLYDDFYAKTCCFNGTEQTVIECFKGFSERAKNALKSYVDIEYINNTLYKWIDYTFDKALKIRENDRYFFLELARGGNSLKDNKKFIEIFNSIGSPLVKNINNKYFRFPSNPDYGDTFQYLCAISTIMDIFSGEFKCSMKDFCEQSSGKTEITVNQYCNNAPWKRCGDKQLCPVALILKHRKLASNEPVLQK